MKKLILISFLFSNILLAQKYFFNEYKIVKNIINLESKNLNDVIELQYEVYNIEDIKLYTIKRNIDFDIPHPGIAIFDDGKAVLINSFNASLEFYNQSGILVNTAALFDDREVTYERSIFYDAEDDLLGVLVSQPEYEQSQVMLFNSDGIKLNSWQFEAKNASGIKISEDQSAIAVSGFNWFHNLVELTNFYTIEGKLNQSFPFKFNKAKFNQEEFVGITNKSACYIDLSSGLLVWSKEAAGERLFADVNISEDKINLIETERPLLESGKWIYSKLILKSLDKSGNIIDEFLIIENKFDELNVLSTGDSLKISADGKVVYSK
jgi:hypothetical protein